MSFNPFAPKYFRLDYLCLGDDEFIVFADSSLKNAIRRAKMTFEKPDMAEHNEFVGVTEITKREYEELEKDQKLILL